GCTYYAEHPGGRNPETRPVNALEAQGRRQARFARLGHTPGPFRLREPRLTPDSTYTLDMRRNAL
ncbi:MAG: transglutaminase family protein, partial [Pseudomonadota bacterium]